MRAIRSVAVQRIAAHAHNLADSEPSLLLIVAGQQMEKQNLRMRHPGSIIDLSFDDGQDSRREDVSNNLHFLEDVAWTRQKIGIAFYAIPHREVEETPE